MVYFHLNSLYLFYSVHATSLTLKVLAFTIFSSHITPSFPDLGEEEVAIVVAGQHVVHQYRRPRPVFT